MHALSSEAPYHRYGNHVALLLLKDWAQMYKEAILFLW